MSGIIGSKFNIRGSGLIGSLGTDGQHFLSSGAGKTNSFETITAAEALTPVRQDVLTLALRQAVQENSTKFNLPNSSICKFEADADFDLSGSTDVTRNASEYIHAYGVTYAAFSDDSDTTFLLHSDTSDGSTTFTDSSSNSYSITVDDDTQHSTTKKKLGDSSIYFDGTGDRLIPDEAALQPGGGAYTVEFWINTTATSRTYLVHSADTSDTGFRLRMQDDGKIHIDEQVSNTDYVAESSSSVNDGNWHHVAISRASGGSAYIYINGTSEANIAANHNFNNSNPLYIGSRSAAGYLTGYLDEIRISSAQRYSGTFTPNGTAAITATATALGTTNVPTSAVTEVSGVLLNKDTSGSTTFGTDVKVYFTADNSNWTEAASYTDAGTFSDTTKMIKLEKTTVTEGSDVRWKIVWANQSDGSKISNVYGIGLNY